MKDQSSFGPGGPTRYIVLGKVDPQHRSAFGTTIEKFYQQLTTEAQKLGGQVHEECSSVIFGPWDVAAYVTLPSSEALFGLMAQANQLGLRTETYIAPSVKQFTQAQSNAWTRTGAKSPVER